MQRPALKSPASIPSCPQDREVKYAATNFDQISLDGSFTGYASLFGRADLGQDMIEPGAFTKSLKTRGLDGIKLLYHHDPEQPIGYWTKIEEDAHGLKVSGQLMTDVARAREILSLMRAGVLDGLSIGFKTLKHKQDRKSGIRHIYEVDLWEISIVTFPMLPEARIASVKSEQRGGLPTIREFEQLLKRDAGLSRSQARMVIHSGYQSLLNKQDAVARYPNQSLLETISKARQLFNQTR